jgi:low temperature requirement protein LtrA
VQEVVAVTSDVGSQPRRTVKHGIRAWFGAGPRRHGEPLVGRDVSYIELFYDLVYVVLIGQAAHTLALHPGWGGVAEFGAVFGLIWIAWINGTLYHELHGREDGRSRVYIFAQMCVLAVLAVFVGYAGSTDGTAFSLTYVALLVLLWWQWYEVRRRDLPEHRSASTPYLVGLVVTIAAMLAAGWLPDVARVAVWWVVVVGWVVLGAYGFVSRDRALQFFQATDALIERMALFVIIVLGETVVGVVNGINAEGPDALRIATGVLGLCIGFGVWWNYFDIVGAREPRAGRPREAAWFFGHLPQCGAIAVAGAAMVGLVTDAHATRTPTAVAWTLGGAVALSLLLVAVRSATVTRDPDELGSRTLLLVFGVGAALALALAAVAPPPWLLALLVIAVLSATWLMTFVPPSSATRDSAR